MDSAKVWIKRVTREIDHVDKQGNLTDRKVIDPTSIVTAFSFVDPAHPESMTTFYADPKKTNFEMTASQAAAALATGGFAVREDSKSEAEDDNPPE